MLTAVSKRDEILSNLKSVHLNFRGFFKSFLQLLIEATLHKRINCNRVSSQILLAFFSYSKCSTWDLSSEETAQNQAAEALRSPWYLTAPTGPLNCLKYRSKGVLQV